MLSGCHYLKDPRLWKRSSRSSVCVCVCEKVFACTCARVCARAYVRARPTCGSEQQGAVVPVQVLHGRDARVARVAIVEVVQPLALLPVPEAGQTGDR